MVAAVMAKVRAFGRVFGLAATYIGTVVGAGFASGQEIWTFFARHGRNGFAGLALAGLLFALAGVRAFQHGARIGAGGTYYQALESMFGRAARVLDLVLVSFLVVLGGVMLAGAAAATPLLGCPAWLGVSITVGLGLLVIAADLQGIVMVNRMIVPILLVVIVAISLPALGSEIPAGSSARRPYSWIPSSLLYASYNTVLSLPVLVALGAAERRAEVRLAGGIAGAMGLSLLGAVILAALLGNAASAAGSEVPMAAVAKAASGPVASFYAFILWAELFTTMVADIYGASVRLRQVFGGNRVAWAAAAMAVGSILCRLGFSRLVRTIYPAFGLICLAVLAGLVRPLRRGR